MQHMTKSTHEDAIWRRIQDPRMGRNLEEAYHMAHTSEFRAVGFSIAPRIAAFRASFTKSVEQYKTYRRTLTELESLTSRELADIGLNRHALRDIAYESAYGA